MHHGSVHDEDFSFEVVQVVVTWADIWHGCWGFDTVALTWIGHHSMVTTMEAHQWYNMNKALGIYHNNNITII